MVRCISFDNCVYLCKHHLKEAIKYSYYPWKILPPAPSPEQALSDFYHYTFFDLLLDFASMKFYSMHTLVSGFFRSIQCLWGSSMSWHVAGVHCFLLLSRSPLVGVTQHVIHSLVDRHLGCFQFVTLMTRLLWTSVYKFLWIYFHFSWEDT